MLEYVVDARGGGDFSTLGAAVNAVPDDEPARLFVRSGIYREKLYCEKNHIEIIGEDCDSTLLTWADGAYHTHADGRKNGTFRSYTAFFSGGFVRVENMTIANTAGDGRIHGQGIAAAVDAREAYFCNVSLLGCQDTLFTGPLPEHERMPDGFLGPKQHAPRLPSRQYYTNCYIRGDIDFIFGGADALFEDCTLHCRNRGQAVNGYIAAPSTPRGGIGYVFYHCTVKHGAAAAGTFYLARPWRAYGRAAFLECTLSEVICADGFDDWDDAQNRTTCHFAEYASRGAGAAAPRVFGTQLRAHEAQLLLSQADALRALVR